MTDRTPLATERPYDPGHEAPLAAVDAPRVKRLLGAPARVKARIAGGLWLIVIVTGGFAFLVLGMLVVRGDAAATATNILGSESLFRLGFAANLVAGVCYLGVTVILYGLLEPVSRSLSLLAASCGFAGVAVGAATSSMQLASFVLLGNAGHPGAFTVDQLQALALSFLRVSAQGTNVSMVFFGLQCLSVGYLIVRSSFVPRALGVLLGIGGAGYVIGSFTSFLAPALAPQVSPYILPAAFVGEGSLCLWLLVKGIRVPEHA